MLALFYGLLRFLAFLIITLLLNIIYQAVLIYLFIIYVKNLLKFPLIRNIAVVVPFGYPAYNIITFLFINIYLAIDLFRELEADL
jgi:hypothetical protein